MIEPIILIIIFITCRIYIRCRLIYYNYLYCSFRTQLWNYYLREFPANGVLHRRSGLSMPVFNIIGSHIDIIEGRLGDDWDMLALGNDDVPA